MKQILNTFFFITLLFFSCQHQKVTTLAFDSNDSISHQIDLLSKNDNEEVLSEIIKLETLQSTPFIMLSAYIETNEHKGEFFYRTKIEKEWSKWQPFQQDTEGESVGRIVFRQNEISEKTTHLQIRSSTPPPSPFQIRLFAPGHSEKNSNAQLRSGENACDCAQPEFLDRNGWCPSGNCPQDATPFPTISTHIIVHHSAGQSVSSDFSAVVRSYWDYHVNTRGWDDIGYNWLIDPNGVIYEGRGNGLQGAHFSCVNGNTTGICMIGNYETAIPSSVSITALENFIAWEACDKNIDPLGNDTHAPSNTALDNISGHRDGNGIPNACGGTVCPGENLYQILENIRTAVAAKACLEDLSTNVNELLEDERITVFPNPNHGYFQVELENISAEQLSIYNALGQLILQKNKKDLSANRTEISMTSSGMYFLKFELKDKRVIERKVIVE